MTKETIAAVRACLTPDLLSPEYRIRYDASNPMAGHCYVASEALYHLGAKAEGYVPRYVFVGEGTHWYLVHRVTGHILDVTYDQFPERPPYHLGHGAGFLTKEPSKRCVELIGRVTR